MHAHVFFYHRLAGRIWWPGVVTNVAPDGSRLTMRLEETDGWKGARAHTDPLSRIAWIPPAEPIAIDSGISDVDEECPGDDHVEAEMEDAADVTEHRERNKRRPKSRRKPVTVGGVGGHTTYLERFPLPAMEQQFESQWGNRGSELGLRNGRVAAMQTATETKRAYTIEKGGCPDVRAEADTSDNGVPRLFLK